MNGMIHIYEGTGKGKTTAGIGLAVRCAGHGFQVLYSQFLKDGSSGEISVLRRIPEITVMVCEKNFGFTFLMNDEQKKEAEQYYSSLFQNIVRTAQEKHCRLLVLDEILDACASGMVREKMLTDFLEHRPSDMEVVLTGRDPSDRLVKLADYITDMRKEKHPFDRGIRAREGIEM